MSTVDAVPVESKNEQSGLLAKGKRKLLALGKKADGQSQDTPATTTTATTTAPTLLPSPGLHSPASQIFERNRESKHIKTEDHIPAALDASSLAITDDHLNPDDVEIVMHAAHQPASAAVAGSIADSLHSPSLVHEEASLFSHPDTSESASNANYGSVDTTDPRRLSFISFADVVQAEHAESDRDAAQFISLSATANRSPSPVRSPVSSQGFGASPPRSGATSEKGPGSPTAHGMQSSSGELQIETMRQALRRTGSGDLSGARSQPLSAISLEDTAADRPPFA
ncbi:hypothetical protein P171DRAFT_436186 [Karstenula rhodostoma CBS 690.94]|uniref:Uncharacterized protein n=1 Tax=Karstenula rhodostoma CBS 690.94 TaxID=1392251 RepID=A0A9P4U802_9PLEO|nr:hypothetical protein P171DRAFT_436186 [Karstenula rhodostoma CBS 690.94]